ncbi:hypothetical protein predicted by Glimmer/Critica (plasmid) [Sinorhizobium fredii HH103]|uniref:Uncharacterized protein n=1 Tax=Sinorhizobium fredii (strain HH103) TaxID=1117943 RepID=G9AIB4_SINF1|nr:hypothetical protein predicted by Glimmer/Critica [Sinorhizobium fredii HH103]
MPHIAHLLSSMLQVLTERIDEINRQEYIFLLRQLST